MNEIGKIEKKNKIILFFDTNLEKVIDSYLYNFPLI